MSRIAIEMDVDKKLGMSLDDLIKKTRSDRPPKKGPIANKAMVKKGGKFDRRGKLGVKKTVGKNHGRNEPKPMTRSAGRSTSRAVVDRTRPRVRKVSTSKDSKMDVDNGDGSKRFSRKVVVKKGPNAPEDERKKVRITNVPYDLTWKDVKGALSDVGKIDRCDVGQGEALVTFSTHKEALRAIQTYHNGDMNGRKIKVFFV